MQHGNRHDEGKVEPVGHIDMRLFALQNGAKKHEEIGDPNNGQPNVDIPFRLGIFAPFRYPHEVTRGGQHNEQLIAPEHKPGEIAQSQPRAASPLHHIKARAQKRITPKGKHDS